MKNKDVVKMIAIYLILFGVLGVLGGRIINQLLGTDSTFFIVEYSFGGVALIGAVILFFRLKKLRNEKMLKENGIIVKAKMISCEEGSWESNHGEGYLMKFEGNYNGKNYNFTYKDSFWISPQIIISDKNIETFDVYVNPKNFNKYLVDISCVKNNIVDLTRFS